MSMSMSPAYWLGRIAQLSQLERNGAMPVDTAFKELNRIMRPSRKSASVWGSGDNCCYWIGQVDQLLRIQKLAKTNTTNLFKRLREVADQFPK